MKKMVFISLILLITGLFFWWFFASERILSFAQNEHASIKKNNNAVISSELNLKNEEGLSQYTTNNSSAGILDPDDDQSYYSPSQNDFTSEVLSDQLQRVADIYEQNSRYPIFSQPILNPNDARELKPFEQSEVKLPFPLDDNDLNPTYLTAATDRFQYLWGDMIHFRLEMTNTNFSASKDVRVILAGEFGDLPDEVRLSPLDSAPDIFTGSVNTQSLPKQLFSAEMLAKFFVSIDGRRLLTTVTFRLATPSAQLTGLSSVNVVGPVLNIPLLLNVFEEGYYFASAVLEDASTGLPLINLQNEGQLAEGDVMMPLNAHVSALKTMGSEGPYILRSIHIFRGAKIDESFDSPAAIPTNQFDIPRFPLSRYEDEDYIDPDAQERAEFIRELGSGGIATDG